MENTHNLIVRSSSRFLAISQTGIIFFCSSKLISNDCKFLTLLPLVDIINAYATWNELQNNIFQRLFKSSTCSMHTRVNCCIGFNLVSSWMLQVFVSYSCVQSKYHMILQWNHGKLNIKTSITYSSAITSFFWKIDFDFFVIRYLYIIVCGRCFTLPSCLVALRLITDFARYKAV